MTKIKLTDALIADGLVCNPKIKTIEYFGTAEQPVWSDIGAAFPNVREILDRVTCAPRTLNADFFRAFPNLNELATDAALDLTGLNTDEMPLITNMLGDAILNNGADLGLFLSRYQDKVLSVTVLSGDIAIPKEEIPRIHQLSLNLVDVDNVNLDFSLCDRLKHLNINQPKSKAPLSLTYKMPRQFDSLLLQVHKLGETKIESPKKMKRLDFGIKSLQKGCEIQINGLVECDKFNFHLAGKVIPENLYPDLKHINYLSLSLPGMAGEIPPAFLSGIETIKYELTLMQDVAYTTLHPLLTRCTDLEKLIAPTLSLANIGALTAAPQLRNLEITGQAMNSDIWPQMQSLVSLSIDKAVGTELPAGLRAHQNVCYLTLTNCALSGLGDLSSMSDLKYAYIFMDAKSNAAKEMTFNELLTVSDLKSVKLEPHPQSQPIEMLRHLHGRLYAHNITLKRAKMARRGAQLVDESRILQQSDLPDATKSRLFTLLYNTTNLAQLVCDDPLLHLTFLEAGYKPLHAGTMKWLGEQAKRNLQAKPLDANSRLFICGKSYLKQAELNKKAKEYQFTLAKQLDDQVTHVVIGKDPVATAQIDHAIHTLIDDTALNEWFEHQAPKFMQQPESSEQGMIDNIIAMLRSPDQSAHLVAIAMLEQGGVTDEMLMPMFYVLKTSADKAFRNKMRELLKGKGCGMFQKAVHDKVMFHDVRDLNDVGMPAGEGEFYKRLSRRVKHWGEDLCLAFSREYFHHHGDGLLYLLSRKELPRNEESPIRVDAINDLVEGETLNWHRGCGFHLVLANANEKQRQDCHQGPQYYLTDGYVTDLKTVLPTWLPKERTIRELNLENCNLGALPKGFEHYTDITRLSLRFNHLSELPASLKKLTKLEELDLSYNHFYEFPAILYKLKSLKKLDFRRASQPDIFGDYQTKYDLVTVPQDFRDAFPDCVILDGADA
ncbi:leucine-rich repeat domain-containing protein [Photobacterium aquae]|uniref:leucine-rich repeat domain-containing protein n=1 Tax=Photobacterium aquae TaxID=1195763 RepID=UPI00069CCD85|nr:leucine-rich repeat domain-containing protein [Photobacterium aquae]